MNVLIVEDERPIADYLQRALKQLGIFTFFAASAEHADTMLDRCEVDGLTLDLAMPGRGGLEWLEMLALERPELARRTLVITGAPLESDSVERLARCGAGLLSKPFTLVELEDAVRTQLKPAGGLPLSCA